MRETLQAVARQTLQPFEVIVVDNNSSDRTAEIAAEFPFVTVVGEPRQGLRFTRNRGMDLARGDVIGRIDADAQLYPTWCEEVAAAFEDPRISCVTGACYYHDMPARPLGYRLDRACRAFAFKIGRPVFYGSNMAVRREVWQQLREICCMQGEFFEDIDLSIHANELGYDITYLPAAVTGVSARRLDDTPREFYRIMQEYDHTLAMHNVRNAAALTAKCIYLASFPFLKAIRRGYDADTETFTWSRCFTAPKTAARPTSNT